VLKEQPTRSLDQLSAELMKQLASKGYGHGTMDNYRRAISRVGKYMKRKGINEYNEEVGKAYMADHFARSDISNFYRMYMKTVLRRLNDINIGIEYRLIEPKITLSIATHYSKLLDSYILACTNLGNKERTLSVKRKVCGEFLCSLVDFGCVDTQEINTDYICRSLLRFNNKDAYTVICSFLHYLYENNVVNADFSGIVPKYHRGKVLPTTYTIDEIHRLEAAVDRTSKNGKRNYAIILLASRLGLRSGDIVRLTFENVDFKGNSINFIQEKTSQPLSLPLLPEIRTAIEEYIKDARPIVESEFLFIGTHAPFKRITTSVVRHSLSEYFSIAGIDISDKKHGSHSLRSSLATSMINNGVPYEVVRRLLGHVDPNVIKHYARLDIENLRCYAIDVPAPSGKFGELLEGRAQQW